MTKYAAYFICDAGVFSTSDGGPVFRGLEKLLHKVPTRLKQ